MTEFSAPQDLTPTPAQTVGPFFGYALPYEGSDKILDPSHPKAIRLHGTVYDGEGTPVPDALLEVWQTDDAGEVPSAHGSLRRDGHTFTGWGRTPVDYSGQYWFTTMNPGAAPGKAPFILLTVFARGLMDRLFTRVYLPDDAEALSKDPLLNSLPEERRQTLIAEREPDGNLRFNVRLQGEAETVFLQYPKTPQFTGRNHN